MSTTTVPLREIHFRTSRSGGPGGQNVNKVETKVEVWWSLEESPSFTPAEKARLRGSLGRRLGADGGVRVVSQKFRSQSRNRDAAVERLRELVADALKPRKSRRATRPTMSSREARLETKKRRAATKRLRISGPDFDG